MTHQRPYRHRTTAGGHVTPHGLVPSANAPWLTPRSWVRPGAYAVFGMLLGLPGLLVLIESLHPARWPNVRFFLILLIPLTLLCLVITLGMVAMQALHRAQYQWCSDCLQYMRRGARVCPFCGFRPASSEDRAHVTHTP